MHVHGVRMSLLARGGSTPAAYEQGLRDTFVVESMQTVSVAVQMAAAASSVPLMVHCHILEHEDAGMMAQFIGVWTRHRGMSGSECNIHRWHCGMVGVTQTSPGVSWMDMEDEPVRHEGRLRGRRYGLMEAIRMRP